MFEHYTYEDSLLTEWGNWARAEDFELKATSAWALVSPQTSKGFSGDDRLMEVVDRDIAKLSLFDRQALKRWYIHGSDEVKRDTIKTAVRNFSVIRDEHIENYDKFKINC